MNSLQCVPAATSTAAPHTHEILAFLLDGQEYGIALNFVQEIRSYEVPTRLAGAQDFLLGVIDLRGEVVPLIDLRRRLGLAPAPFDAFTVVIVVSLSDRRVGVVADRVNDVVQLAPEQIRAMPAMSSVTTRRHLVGIASLEARSVVLTDIQALLADILADAPLAQAA